MCFNLADFDPTEVLLVYDNPYEEALYVDSYPMSDDDWEEWLENE